MSMPALRWCRPIQLPPTQKLVLFALADAANDAGECWPSMASLVEATCLSERSVQASLVALVAAGLVAREAGGGRYRTSLYRVLTGGNPAGGAETPRVVRGIAAKETPQVVRETPQVVRETPQVVRETPQVLHPEPSEPPRTPRTLTDNERARSPPGFDRWWSEYPRRVGKGAAANAYRSALKSANEADLLVGLRRQRWPAEPKFVPHPATWLNQRRWEDDPNASAPAEAPRNGITVPEWATVGLKAGEFMVQ